MSAKLTITLLVDNSESWITPFAEQVLESLASKHDCRLIHDHVDIPTGEVLFLLGCTKRVPLLALKRNRHNLVIHESTLPIGRGWSPISWQVLEGKNRIPMVVFEAIEELDAGDIYLRDFLELDGTELLNEIKAKQGAKTVELVHRIIDMYPKLKAEKQKGKPSYFSRRSREDDRLDVEKSILENFNHLRIVDNERFPAWFKHRGQEYILKIYKKDASHACN